MQNPRATVLVLAVEGRPTWLGGLIAPGLIQPNIYRIRPNIYHILTLFLQS